MGSLDPEKCHRDFQLGMYFQKMLTPCNSTSLQKLLNSWTPCYSTEMRRSTNASNWQYCLSKQQFQWAGITHVLEKMHLYCVKSTIFQFRNLISLSYKRPSFSLSRTHSFERMSQQRLLKMWCLLYALKDDKFSFFLSYLLLSQGSGESVILTGISAYHLKTCFIKSSASGIASVCNWNF